MVYDFRYINKQVFESSVCYTLIIEETDNEEVISITRVEKSFKCDENIIDDEYLRIEAKLEIKKLLASRIEPVIVDEVTPEDAISDG